MEILISTHKFGSFFALLSGTETECIKMLYPFLADQNQSHLPTDNEIDLMANVLETRLGKSAAEIANFFAIEHEALGDKDRSKAWADVARRILKKTPLT